LQNYNGKRTGPRVSNFLADFESHYVCYRGGPCLLLEMNGAYC
jgi:hypothetical protein